MSYQVLARKWRPSKFSELVGQEHVVTAISNALDNDRLHHAYLFTGTRGVGKTTIARIFAKSLNCDTGQTSQPCGQCGTCKEIDQGRFIDLLEIDAASRTKVEDTRELLDNVQYRPSRGNYKVYLIDEVHMLSKHSFNALLKTLEEPPAHVKFLLATTDPQKLPVTILSRCLQFNLKALSREQINQQLNHILQAEQITHEPSALGHLARAANGSMRDALSLTDQAIAQGNNQVLTQTVVDMLGLLDSTQILKILHALAINDGDALMTQIDDLAAQSASFASVLDELLATLHQIALTQLVPNACKLETITARAIYNLSKSFSPEHIQLLYQIGVDGKRDLPHSVSARVAFEMTVLRMLSFTPALELDNFDEIIQSQMQANQVAVSEKVVFDAATPTSTPTATLPTTTPFESSAESLPEQHPAVAQRDVLTPESEPTRTPESNDSSTPTPPLSDTLNTEVTPVVNKTVSVLDEVEDEQPKREDLNTVIPDMFGESPSKSVSEPTKDYAFAEHADATGDEAPVDVSDEQRPPPDLDDLASHEALMAEQNDIYEEAQAQHPEAFSQPVNKPAVDDLLAVASSLDKLKLSQSESETPQSTEILSDISEPQPITNTPDNDDVTHDDILPDDSHVEVVQDQSDPPESESAQEQPIRDIVSPSEVAPTHSDNTAHSHSRVTLPEEPSESIILAQPESDPSKMGLTDHGQQDSQQYAYFAIDADNLVANLPNGEPLTHEAQIDKWANIIHSINPQSLTRVALLHSTMVKRGDEINLTIDETQQHLVNTSMTQTVQNLLSQYFNESVNVQFDVGQPANTPMQLRKKIKTFRLQHSQQLLDNDDTAQSLFDLFGAVQKDDSLKPKP